MAGLRKYWWHVNVLGLIVTLLFSAFLAIWGVNAVAPYDSTLEIRIGQATDAATIRAECSEMNARVRFANGAGISIGRVSALFLCLVLFVFVLNIRLIQRVHAEDQPNSLGRRS